MPEFPILRTATTVHPDRSLFGTQDITKISAFYSLSLVQLEGATVSLYESPSYYVGPGESTGSVPVEFIFTVPPKVLEVHEPFATHITPTQNAGRFVEGHGSILKSVRISGTTGVRPRTGTPQASPPKQFIPPRQLAGIEPVGSNTNLLDIDTGHDMISRLKNLFRIYSDLTEKGNSDVLMVWRNIKDGEYWVVEPENVAFTSDSKSPLTTSYTINLKTVVQFTELLVDKPGARSLGSNKSFQTVLREATQDINRGMLIVSTAPQSITKAALNFVNPVTGVAMAAAQTPSMVFAGFISAVRALENGTIGASERVILQAFHLANMAINARIEMSKSALFGSHVDRVKNAWKRIQLAAERVIASDLNSDSSQRYRRNRDKIIRAYTKNATTSTTSSDSSFLGNVQSSTTVAQAVIQQGDNIRTLALRLCGDAKNWKDLVLLNELVPPYISPVPTDRKGVLCPGQIILYPSRAGSKITQQRGVSRSVDNDFEDATNDFLLNYAYGTDIRLESKSEDLEYADIALNDRGDFATIRGVPNVQQAIRIKFSVEQGELRAHPYFGARYGIGRKATIRSLDEFRLNSLATLLSDPRIAEVKDVTITTVGDSLYFFARIRLVESQEFTNVSFDLRN